MDERNRAKHQTSQMVWARSRSLGQFRRRYATEVHDNAALLDQLRSFARRGPITLVYSAHDELHNDAVVLRDLVLGRKTA